MSELIDNLTTAVNDIIICENYADAILNGTEPKIYKELEYIQSTGTQYIDTELTFPTGFKLDTKLNITSVSNSVYIAGGMTYSGGVYNRSYIGQYSNVWYLGMYDDYSTGRSIPTGEHIIEASTISGSGYIKLDGTSVVTSSKVYENSNIGKCYFLWWSYNDYDKLKAKVYYAKFYNADNELVRDFIPARNLLTGAVGLYDKVGHKWYYNSGTGDFIAGPDKEGA